MGFTSFVSLSLWTMTPPHPKPDCKPFANGVIIDRLKLYVDETPVLIYQWFFVLFVGKVSCNVGQSVLLVNSCILQGPLWRPSGLSLSHHFPSTKAFPLCALTLSSLHTALSSLIFVDGFCSLPPFPVFLLSRLRSNSSKEPSVIRQDWVTCPSLLLGAVPRGPALALGIAAVIWLWLSLPADCLVAHVGHSSWHITCMYLSSTVPGVL